VTVLAFDLGASSGKAVIGQFNGDQLEVKEIHRFLNEPVGAGNHLYWDILRLYHEIEQGLLKSKQFGFNHLESIGIDSWAVDFGFLDKHGELLGNPYHYRDHQCDGMINKLSEFIPLRNIYNKTGIQFIPINTINQLLALKINHSQALEVAESMLMIPDLIRYFLTGEKTGEKTNASTTQLLNAFTSEWDYELIDQLKLPSKMFLETVYPGHTVGRLRQSVSEKLNLPHVSVVTVGEHDTASAVAAVPTIDNDFAYLSCGTWSLLGTELDQPILEERAFEWNFTNELGVNKRYRFLKNIMGLWILQECMREWGRQGHPINYNDMDKLINGAKPLKSFIDPDHDMFLNPFHMPNQIIKYCEMTGQPVPETNGEIIRCVLESLALKYRFVLERTEELSGKTFLGLHMVGGGIKNRALCQFTSNAIKRPVWAGPSEATAIGNIIVQYIASQKIRNLTEGREIVKKSFEVREYVHENETLWEEAYGKFLNYLRNVSDN
jgi:rhamnulokinase